MSMGLFLLLPLDAPLKTVHLNEIAEKLNIPIIYNSDIDLGTHSGFLPATVNGVKTAVEMFKLSFAEVSYILRPNKDINSENTLVIQFRLGGNSNETLIALYTALLYLSGFNGIAFDSMSNKYFNTEKLQQKIDELLK